MGWFMNLLATKYGRVTGGKHKGCGMSIGSDEKGVKMGSSIVWTKLLFIKGTKMIEEVRIETLKSYKILAQSVKETTIVMTYADGQKDTVVLPALDANGKPWVNDRVGLILGALANVPAE